MQPIQLSDTQRTILTTACQREGGLVLPLIASLRGGAVGIVLGSLMKKGLIEELLAGEGDAVWRTSKAGEALTLRVTPLTFEALGMVKTVEADPGDMPKQDGAPNAEEGAAEGATFTDTASPTSTTRTGSKQAALIAMLRRPEGASLNEIVTATGWQAHTVRGAISGALKKRMGLAITSERVEGRGRVYRVAS